MKHRNKKGFTIVELVIVIAVIAILAAVLIPNLSRLVTKADKSAAMQEAKAAMDNDLINAEGALSNMDKYTVTENSKKTQYYVISETESRQSSNSELVMKVKGETVSILGKDTADSDTNGAKYYSVAAYNGTFTVTDEATGAGKYEITCKDFKCTFENGAWTIEK